MGLRHLTKQKGDYMFSVDLKDAPHAAHALTGRAHILPYVNDFLLFGDTEAAALGVRARLLHVLDALSLERHAEKGFWEPAQFGLHLGINIDSTAGVFYAPRPEAKLLKLASHAKQLLGKASRNARWLPANGKPIHRPVDTAYLHTDNSGYGLGGVLNGRLEARGFCLTRGSAPHTIDWFVPALNVLLPRYNAWWLDPTSEAVDALHLGDAAWRGKNNWCNAPEHLLSALV
eukprot:jgi/Tetstr1/453074/TSEL_040109.t1